MAVIALGVLVPAAGAQTRASHHPNAVPPALSFRSDASMVLINASVFDRDGRLITDLSRDGFRVFDEKDEVSIRQFSLEDTPLSTVILLDMSRSMKRSIGSVREALGRFLAGANRGDDFCLIQFSDSVNSGCEFTSDRVAILDAAHTGEPKGSTAFLDAVVAGIEKAKTGPNPRRAVLILSDVRDTASRFRWKDAIARARESTACLYAVSPMPVRDDEFADRERLEELVETTGGRIFEVRGPADYEATLDGLDIRHQYVIGYAMPAASDEGKWRKVRVQLQAQDKDDRKFQVYWRRGYYSRAH